MKLLMFVSLMTSTLYRLSYSETKPHTSYSLMKIKSLVVIVTIETSTEVWYRSYNYFQISEIKKISKFSFLPDNNVNKVIYIILCDLKIETILNLDNKLLRSTTALLLTNRITSRYNIQTDNINLLLCLLRI